MKPEGNLPEILDLEKEDSFYGTGIRSAYRRSPRSGTLKNQVRDELRKFTVTEPGEKGPDENQVLRLARILHYYVPYYNAATLSSRSSFYEQKVTPERAVKISLLYVESGQHGDNGIEALETELVKRFMKYIEFRIRSRIAGEREDLQSDIESLQHELASLREREESLSELYHGKSSLSLIDRIKRWMRYKEISRKYASVEKKRRKVEQKLRWLQKIKNVESDYQKLCEWRDIREEKHKQACNYDEFESTYDYLHEKKQQGKKISDINVGELRNLLEGAAKFLSQGMKQTIEVKQAAPQQLQGGGEGEAESESGEMQTVPSYLELKDEYSNQEIHEVFSAINGDQLDLGEDHSRIRTMLMSGNARGAVREIREVMGID